MTEGQWLLTHLENITKWVQEKRDYAVANYTVVADGFIEDNAGDGEIIRDGRMVSAEYVDEEGTFFIDLRLQYWNSEIIPHSGLSDYDQDHHGVWSSSAVEWCADNGTCADIALELLKDLWNEIPEV